MAINPISFSEQVVADFLRYQLTTYPLADEPLYTQLRDLLRLDETRTSPLRRGPFLSLSRPFRPGATIAELVSQGVLHPAMQGIVPFDRLRAHQEQAIRAIRAGETTLVATGTGSGKTESFLYPIISRAIELQAAGAPPGVLAVLIYPMNALAEDQLDRMRGLLAGRGISFGMYVGKTPEEESQIRGERMPQGSSNADYKSRLKQIREAGQDITLLPPEERASRAALRRPDGPPRILLTNVKQLELLLTRGKDVGIFANAPLEYLVFDEAHTFRGAQGAETACLIRRLRTFCGKAPDQVTCIATSATMADPRGGDASARDFARRFFGVAPERVRLVGEVYDELRWNHHRSTPDGPPADPAAVLGRLLRAVDAPDDQVSDALTSCLLELGGARLPRTRWQAALTSQLASNEIVFHLATLLERPRALAELPAMLQEQVGREVPESEILAWLALGAATGRGEQDPLLRPVAHTFVRGVGGAVVTLSGPESTSKLWLSGEDAESELGSGWCRFPLITCTTCGQHYYVAWVKDFKLKAGVKAGPEGGDKVGRTRVWEHLAEELGGSRALLIDRMVVASDEDDDAEELDEDGDPLPVSAHDIERPRLHPLWICRACGALHEERSPACAACPSPGALVAVQVVRTREDNPGQLSSCVACQSPGRRPRGGRYREPARPVRAVSVSDVHVLAQSMVHKSERPRLLVFADNRQDAAFQAGWMRDHARRFRLRALMAQQIPEGGASVGDVTQSLDELLGADRELSRALIPEVWQYVPQEDAGVKHREERVYYLRLQVLREIALGVKQRLGLEPWGRLRVSYLGLDEQLPFVGRWSARMNLPPAALVEGLEALLDHLRRIRLVHDGTTRFFGQMWGPDKKEVQYGYIPVLPGGPKGMKLSRGADDTAARVTQWIGSRPTQVWSAVKGWGLSPDDIDPFLRELWSELARVGLILPVSLTGWGRPLPGATGVYQLDAGRLRLHPNLGRWRCERCRRTTVHRGPGGTCMAWRCGGDLAWELEDPDNFDLRLLDGDYKMLRAAEHSAQVPTALRERYENHFKGEGEQVNTLVCTPTLELGVDIGALDAVLMRNVPPTAANYWQRAGRAGRRHRMAVDLTYAQATGFDQAYFRDPLKLLSGAVEPPRFNLKNELMIRKHVHATVLTALHALARRGTEVERAEIGEVLQRCLPPMLGPYLFTPDGAVMAKALDVGPLGALIARHRASVLAEVRRAFLASWPAEDAAAVTEDALARMVDGMADALAEVIGRLKRRLDWARDQLAKLATVEATKGVLDAEDQAQRRRCQQVIARLKGTARRTRSSAQGGQDDSETMGALAREGFLPGYGLDVGSIVGLAEPPRLTEGLDDFELARPPILALREFVPGNAIYANGFRFVPRRFQLTADDTLRFRVVTAQQVVQEIGVNGATAMLGEQEIRAVPVCDAILPSQSQISDEEEFRFQMPVATYGNDRGYHRGGASWSWSGLDLRFRRGVHLRLVNVGPRSEVEQARLGFPLCLACGQSLSPYASRKAREDFEKSHLTRCGHIVQPTGFYCDVDVDVLGLHDAEDRTLGFSVIEAIRMGAARVLDMEVEDLQLLALGHPGEDKADVMLYDPMPGGSGLLEQLTARWDEVRCAALDLLHGCPGACEASCIDCLQTYRNRFYHRWLNRHKAAEVLGVLAGPLGSSTPLPEHLPRTQSTTGQPQTPIETRFRRFLVEAGLPDPLCQHPLDLGPGWGRTIPDFYYAGEDEEPGVCVYVDGMSAHIHGNDDQAAKDRFLRERLRSLGYEVFELRSHDLDDRPLIVRTIAKIALLLVGKEKQRAVRDDNSWFERAGGVPAPSQAAAARPRLRLIRTAPETPGAIAVVDLRIAAGQLSEGQVPEAIDHVLLPESLRRPWRRFVARIVGTSMDRVAPDGAWCLWDDLRDAHASGPAPGELLVVRAPAGADPELGRFTFKRFELNLNRAELAPISSDPRHQPIPVDEGSELEAIARFVDVVEVEG